MSPNVSETTDNFHIYWPASLGFKSIINECPPIQRNLIQCVCFPHHNSVSISKALKCHKVPSQRFYAMFVIPSIENDHIKPWSGPSSYYKGKQSSRNIWDTGGTVRANWTSHFVRMVQRRLVVAGHHSIHPGKCPRPTTHHRRRRMLVQGDSPGAISFDLLDIYWLNQGPPLQQKWPCPNLSLCW